MMVRTVVPKNRRSSFPKQYPWLKVTPYIVIMVHGYKYSSIFLTPSPHQSDFTSTLVQHHCHFPNNVLYSSRPSGMCQSSSTHSSAILFPRHQKDSLFSSQRSMRTFH